MLAMPSTVARQVQPHDQAGGERDEAGEQGERGEPELHRMLLAVGAQRQARLASPLGLRCARQCEVRRC